MAERRPVGRPKVDESGTARVSASLPAIHHDAMKAAAEADGVPYSELVRQAVVLFLEDRDLIAA